MLPTRLGLQSKIIILTAVVVISVVAVSTFTAVVLTWRMVEEDIYLKALAQAKATAHQLVNQHALQDSMALLQRLRQMERDFPGVQQSDVYLHTPDHRLVATTVPQGDHLELDHLPGIESYLEFERPDEDTITIETLGGKFWIMGTTVRERDQPIACLILKVSKSHTTHVTRGLVLRNLLLMLASLVVIILAIHVFFLKRVRGPVKRMIRAMEAAESGQLDVRAAVESQDEIGELAMHLDRSLNRIENFNAELGRRVEEATAELARRNEELRRINAELFETQKSLARSERLAVAGQLAASLAHEIGTPLNSISGQGMGAETLARIFEPMFSTKRMGTGAGLGLGICEQIVRQHAGTIQVESTVGRGTRFTIVFPLDCREKLEATAKVASGVNFAP